MVRILTENFEESEDVDSDFTSEKSFRGNNDDDHDYHYYDDDDDDDDNISDQSNDANTLYVCYVFQAHCSTSYMFI